MKVKFYKPVNQILQKYIDGYYFRQENEPLESGQYVSFPNNYCIATVCQNADVRLEKNKLSLFPSSHDKIASHLHYNNSSSIEIFYQAPRNQVTVYFKPLGILHFVEEIEFETRKNMIRNFEPYPDYLIRIGEILKLEDREKQIGALENYWLSKLRVKDLRVIEEVLRDIEENVKISEIAHRLGLSRQYLHRMFFQYIGKSPSEYRKSHRFKRIVDNYKTAKNFTEISYKNDFCDQPHFNRQFRDLTRISPGFFFKNVDISESNFWLYV